jgi:hypothetical protein
LAVAVGLDAAEVLLLDGQRSLLSLVFFLHLIERVL